MLMTTFIKSLIYLAFHVIFQFVPDSNPKLFINLINLILWRDHITSAVDEPLAFGMLAQFLEINFKRQVCWKFKITDNTPFHCF